MTDCVKPDFPFCEKKYKPLFQETNFPTAKDVRVRGNCCKEEWGGGRDN